MANGLNAILGFENSNVLVKRGFSSIYDCCRYVGVLSCYCGIIVVFEVFIHKLTGNQVLNEQIPLIVMGGMVFNFNDFNHNFDTFKFGTKHDKTRAFISIGSVFTTVWAIIISYFLEFGLSNSLSTINFMVLLGLY
jgi:membrane protein